LYKEHPYRYALSRVSVLMRLNALQYPSRLNETDRWKDFYNRSNNKTVGFILADFLLKTLTNPVLWFICGLLVIKRLGMKVMPILLPVLYINIVYCPFEGAPRFAMPILPFYLIGGAAMMFYLLKKLEHKFVCFEKFVRYFGKKVNAF